ncbi:DUF4254 domain-containing protein [Nocardia stercoris]|uniref:DUF4254 domain-containing protein n=1 Tax=Nocardia stercoris TaxID=2483361 RepID=A0A3M2L6R4_9NOCA|nr:DUF4254 domain-containing protein [Nocardia stercoris]
MPDWHELLAAFCGRLGDRPGDHPVTRGARGLADLHWQRLHSDPTEIDRHRLDHIHRIDEWVGANLRRAAPRSLGAAVDTMAAAQVRAVWMLHSAEDVADERVHTAWFRLARLAGHWTDLALEVA